MAKKSHFGKKMVKNDKFCRKNLHESNLFTIFARFLKNYARIGSILL